MSVKTNTQGDRNCVHFFYRHFCLYFIIVYTFFLNMYVVTQAKHIMDMYPKQTVKETAYQLGFPTTGYFCRYFKRATGIYPQEYKERKIR